jgi:hypothetical protein
VAGAPGRAAAAAAAAADGWSARPPPRARKRCPVLPWSAPQPWTAARRRCPKRQSWACLTRVSGLRCGAFRCPSPLLSCLARRLMAALSRRSRVACRRSAPPPSLSPLVARVTLPPCCSPICQPQQQAWAPPGWGPLRPAAWMPPAGRGRPQPCWRRPGATTCRWAGGAAVVVEPCCVERFRRQLLTALQRPAAAARRAAERWGPQRGGGLWDCGGASAW